MSIRSVDPTTLLFGVREYRDGALSIVARDPVSQKTFERSFGSEFHPTTLRTIVEGVCRKYQNDPRPRLVPSEWKEETPTLTSLLLEQKLYGEAPEEYDPVALRRAADLNELWEGG